MTNFLLKSNLYTTLDNSVVMILELLLNTIKSINIRYHFQYHREEKKHLYYILIIKIYFCKTLYLSNNILLNVKLYIIIKCMVTDSVHINNPL